MAVLMLGITQAQYDWKQIHSPYQAGQYHGIVIDNRDLSGNTIYLAGHSGLWKSTNRGNSWQRLNFEHAVVSCIDQAVDGTIYFGTGEDLYYSYTTIYSTGLYYLNANDSAILIPGTQFYQNNTSNYDWMMIWRIACHPTDANILIVSNDNKTFTTNDRGATWTLLEGVNIRKASISYSKNSNYVIVAGHNRVLRSTDGGNTWSRLDSTNLLPAFAYSGGGRKEVCFSQAANGVAYMSVASQTGGFRGVFRTADGGNTWQQIQHPTTNFRPFGESDEGWFVQRMVASPVDSNLFYLMSFEVNSWHAQSGWHQCMLAKHFPSMSEQHEIALRAHCGRFHPSNPNELFIATGQGLFYTHQAHSHYQAPLVINKSRNLNGSLVYDVEPMSTNSLMLCGADLGVLETPCQAEAPILVNQNDGFMVAQSKINPNVRYYTGYLGRLHRSMNNGQSYYSPYDIKTSPVGGNMFTRCTYSTGFSNTPFYFKGFLAETTTAYNSTDFITYVATEYLPAGSTIQLNSKTASYPISHRTTYDLQPGQKIFIPDPVKSRLFVFTDCGVWFTPDAAQQQTFNRWYKLNNHSSSQSVTSMAQSSTGDTLYYCTRGNVVGRIIRFNSEADLTYLPGTTHTTAVSDSNFSFKYIFGNTVFLSIYVDPKDSRVVIVGGRSSNGGGNGVIFKSVDAGDTWQLLYTFKENPVEDVLIDKTNSKHLMAATKFGLYHSLEGGITWNNISGAMGSYPVTRIKQIAYGCDTCYRYFATVLGRGAWMLDIDFAKSCSYNESTGITPVPDDAKEYALYPNPNTGQFNLSGNFVGYDVSYKIYDISGREVKHGIVQDNQYRISGLSNGYYVLQLLSPSRQFAPRKIVVQ